MMGVRILFVDTPIQAAKVSFMTTYQDRKAERTARYHREHGLKLITCTACNGSGIYDNHGTPPCGCCGGTGKVRERPPSPPVTKPHWRETLRRQEALKAARRARR